MGKGILGLRKTLARWLGSAEGEEESGDLGAGGPALDPEIRQSPAVVALFLETAPQQAADMRAALDAGKVTELKALAHKLRGSCLVMGATALAAHAKALEGIEGLAGARDGVGKVERELARVEASLRARG